MADASAASPPSPAAPSPFAADDLVDARLAPWPPFAPWPAPGQLHHDRRGGGHANPLFTILPASALAIGVVLLVAVAVILVMTRRSKPGTVDGAGGASCNGDKPGGAPASSCGSSVRGYNNSRYYAAAAGKVHIRREAGFLGAAAEPRRSGVHVPGAGERNGRVQRVQRGGPRRVRGGLPRPARRRHHGRHQAAQDGRPARGRARVPHRGRPAEPDALAVPGGVAGLLRRPEPPAASVRVYAKRQPQEPPPQARSGAGGAAAAAGLADAAGHRAGLRPRAGVPPRAQLPRGDPPRLQVQQHPPRPQLPCPRLRLRHGQARLQQGQRPGHHPRPRHHRLPRPRVRVDREADDKVGRVQLRRRAPRAAHRAGARRHEAAAGTARTRLVGPSAADEPREARADGGSCPDRPVLPERSGPGGRHHGDVHTDEGGLPAADDGRGAVADPHREEPTHVLHIHAAEGRARAPPRPLHEPEQGVFQRRCTGNAMHHAGLGLTMHLISISGRYIC